MGQWVGDPHIRSSYDARLPVIGVVLFRDFVSHSIIVKSEVATKIAAAAILKVKWNPKRSIRRPTKGVSSPPPSMPVRKYSPNNFER